MGSIGDMGINSFQLSKTITGLQTAGRFVSTIESGKGADAINVNAVMGATPDDNKPAGSATSRLAAHTVSTSSGAETTRLNPLAT